MPVYWREKGMSFGRGLAMRRTALLALALALSLCGCAWKNNPSAAPQTQNAVAAAIDIGEYVPLKLFLLGAQPADAGVVEEALSERLKENINASLSIEYLPWADYQVRYPIVLAGAEQVDMIYTSDWCFYQTEALRGAFYELTPDFMQTYMPLTLESESPVAFEQARINGKIYMICANGPGVEGESWIAVRGDLREAYGLEPIRTLEQLEVYFQAVADNEKNIKPYAASGEAKFFHILYEQRYNLDVVSPRCPWIARYAGEETAPPAEDLCYRYFTPEYLEFAQKMKQYAAWGFWERGAITNATPVREAFEKGSSASLLWNQTIFRAGETLEQNNPGTFAEYIDLYPGTIRRMTPYTNDGVAIAAFSRHPERAAMCLDLLKNDQALNDMIKGGMEGLHWIDAGEGLFSPGPAASRYPWNQSQWGFNMSRDRLRRSAQTTQFELDFEKEQLAMVVHPVYENFRFNRTPVAAEWAAIEALETEYLPLLELGVTDDPAATIEEFRTKLVAAGFEKVDAEFRAQYRDWVEAR